MNESMIEFSQPKLFEHGIMADKSDIRCHVAPITRLVYTFQTHEMKRILSEPHGFKKRQADQPGVVGRTSEGWLVPIDQIPGVRRTIWKSEPWWDRFDALASTSAKGRAAESVVRDLLALGRIPLWLIANSSKDAGFQMQGRDYLCWGRWVISVKCDLRAGPVSDGGTGNLYIETAERNPLRLI